MPSENTFLSFKVEDELYVGTLKDTIYRLTGSGFTPLALRHESGRKGQQIYGIVPFKGDTLLLGLYPSRFMFLSRSSGHMYDPPQGWWEMPRAVLAQGALPYSMKRLGNGNIGVGLIFTDEIGYIELGLDGSVKESLGTDDGLKDPFVMDIGESDDGSLWLMQNDGITIVEQQSQFRHFTEDDGISGAILDVIRFDGRLYLATMSGLYYQDTSGKPPRFEMCKDIPTSVWRLIRFYNPLRRRNTLLALGVRDLYEVQGTRAKVVPQSSKNALGGYSMCPSSHDSRKLFVGRSEGVVSIRLNDRGVWGDFLPVAPEATNSEIRNLIHDADSTLWCSTYTNGVILAHERGDSAWDTRHIGLEQGLPSLRNNVVLEYNGQVYIGTETGLMRYDWARDTILNCGMMALEGAGVSHFTPMGNNIVLQRYRKSTNTYYMEMIHQLPKGELLQDSIPFMRLPRRWGDVIAADNDSTAWLAYSTTLYHFAPQKERNYNTPFRAFIRSIRTTHSNALVFGGTFFKRQEDGNLSIEAVQPSSQRVALPYTENAIQIEVGCDFFEGEKVEYSIMLEGSDERWSKWDEKSEYTYNNLFEGSYTLKVRARNIYGNISQIAEFSFTVRPPFYRTIWAYIFYVLLLVGSFWGLTILNTRRIVAEKQRLEKIVEERTQEVVEQKEKIEAQNTEIVSSITYASKIQQAVLPSQELIDSIFPEHFLLFLPRDVVSGDFYWMMERDGRKVCAIADCTGHGVPGGFMSMLGTTFLHQIARSGKELHTDEMLNELRKSVIKSLHQTDKIGSNKDGMDIALYILDEAKMELEFSGANNPLVIIRNGEILQYKADKMPVAIYLKGDTPFTRQIVPLQKGDMLYTFSDGYADQFGGPSNRKFMIKNLKEFFVEIAPLPMDQQRAKLLQRLLEWQGNQARTDDVIVFGVRV